MISPINAFRGLRAVARIVMDPANLDEVFVLADLTENSERLETIVTELRRDPDMAKIFEAKPRLGPIDPDSLASLPEGTVGQVYAKFMHDRGLRPEDLPLLAGDERDIDWIRNHFRETHDLWHVVTGFDTDVAGELGLQAFYAAQVSGPLAVLILSIGLANTVFKAMDDAHPRLDAIARGWLLGKRAKPLFGLRFADRFGQSLDELRAELNLDLEGVEAVLAHTTAREVLAEAA